MDYSDHPRKLVTLNPKLKSTGAGRYQLLSRCGCLPQAAWLKDFSPKSQDAVALRRLRSVALYLWLIVVISVRQSTVAAISGLHCRALVMVSSTHKADSLIAKFKEGRNGQRDWWRCQSHRDYLRLVICIIVQPSRAVNHYQTTPLPMRPARQKCRRTEAGERGNYWHADASAWCWAALDAKYTKELADAKAENDALRDDVAAGRRRVKPPPPPAWIMQPPPTGRHRWTGLFLPQREGWSLYETTEGTQKYNNWVKR